MQGGERSSNWGAQAADVDPLKALLVDVAAGDRAAFKVLYDRCSGRLLAILIRMIGRRDLAEDVLQDSFLTIWQKAKLYSPSLGAPMAWMTTLVRRKAIDRLRLVWREAPGSESDVSTLEQNQDFSLAVPEAALNVAMRRALESLSHEYRKAIELTYLYGLTNEELAEKLAVPLGTAKSRVRRGLAQLKALLT